MNNKILIDSIIALCILIGVSFTTVVGYNNIESNLGVSPLFNIRSSRAIDGEGEDLVCEYVGKGNGINLHIPDRDDKKAIIQKILERIQVLDDEAFNRYVDYLIKWAYQNNRINGDYRILNEVEISDVPSLDVVCTIDGEWFIGCYILEILLFLSDVIGLFLALFCYVMTLYWTCQPNCTWDFGI